MDHQKNIIQHPYWGENISSLKEYVYIKMKLYFNYNTIFLLS